MPRARRRTVGSPAAVRLNRPPRQTIARSVHLRRFFARRPTYVSAELIKPTGLPGHAWIELDGLIIDITADGFAPNAPEVIVEENSEWHEKFEILDEHPVGISMYQQDHIVRNLLAAYHEIVGLQVH